MTEIMVNGVKAYSVGCVTVNMTCSERNETVCNGIISGANITCSTKCCDTEMCNMPKLSTEPETTPPPTSGGPDDTTPTSGVEFFAPKVIALLAAYLSALYLRKQ